MKRLEVENQRFEFGGEWTVAFKYDDTRFYRNGPERLKGELEETDGNGANRVIPQSTRSVDVVALHRDDGLLLLEAKDFRGYQIENKKRLNGPIAVEVALKAKDTVAGLIGAARKRETEFDSAQILTAMQAGRKLTVVLWLEDDTFRGSVQRTKTTLKTLTDVLKQKLSWLDVRALVQSSSVDCKLRDLTVDNLAGAGQPNR